MTIIVDEDIDVYDQDHVLWAVLTRCNPTEQLHIVDNMLSFPLRSDDACAGEESSGRHDPWQVGDRRHPAVSLERQISQNDGEIRTELKTQLLEKWREFFAEL